MKTKEIIKRIIFHFLCVVIGGVFLFSAFTKLYPIEYFEYTFVDLNLASWGTAPFFARILIGLEGFTGLLFISTIRLRKLAIPLATFLLVVFSIHLVEQIYLNGNKGNCGCFGNFLLMSPLEAIIKNAVLLVLIFVVWLFKSYRGWNLHYYFVGGLLLISGSMPFVLNPVDISASVNIGESKSNYPLDIHWLYENPNGEIPPINLREGKHILAFLSMTCPHCRLAAYKLHVMHKENPDLPIFLVLNGTTDKLNDFYSETKAQDLPYVIFLGSNFLKMSGIHLPAIYLLNNGIVDAKPAYIQMDQKEVEKWLSDKK